VRNVRNGRAVNPGVPFLIMKQVIPLRPALASVRVNTTPHSASCACEMKILVPLRT